MKTTMTRFVSRLFLLLSIIASACGGGDSVTQTGTCLTDGQLCSLALRVTTKDDVLKRFGTPSDTTSGTGTGPSLTYVCLRIDNGVILYSEGVGLQFDTNNLLTSVLMSRSGTEATPLPACVATLTK
jgi:hypothetical protein